MSTGLGIEFVFESSRVGGANLAIFVSKPVLDDRMNCWMCRIRFESDKLLERDIYGASSLQALALAAGIIPSLILTLFPEETYVEGGVPVVMPTEEELLLARRPGK
jgi:hypothetical protein